ncbi:MAG: acyl carrier protein [Planctomycetota bacterium]|nr:acyl carrier protein [Planctomycetota bacterium]
MDALARAAAASERDTTSMGDKAEMALDVLAKVSGRPKGELKPEQDLVADLGVDSPKGLQLLAGLEDTLKIEIGDEDAAAMQTVGDVLAYVRKLG